MSTYTAMKSTYIESFLQVTRYGRVSAAWSVKWNATSLAAQFCVHHG